MRVTDCLNCITYRVKFSNVFSPWSGVFDMVMISSSWLESKSSMEICCEVRGIISPDFTKTGSPTMTGASSLTGVMSMLIVARGELLIPARYEFN